MARTVSTGRIVTAFGILSLGLGATAGPAFGQAAAGDKPVTIVVGYGSGGLYHTTSLMLSRHMGRFLPGKPSIIVKPMPGAGSLVATNYIANVAPKDGSVLGMVGGGTVLEPLFGNDKAKFDPRSFGWLGSTSTETNVCAIWHSVPIASLEDAKKRQVIAGSTGRGSRTLSYPNALNEMAGTRFKIVTGYRGGVEITRAMESGEAEAYCGWSWGSIKMRSADWVKDGKLRFLVQFGYEKVRDLPNVPAVLDLLKTDRDRAAMKVLLIDTYIAWPLMTPPGLPRDKVAALRRAYMAVHRDPALLADAARLKIEIAPVSGEDLQNAIAKLYETPKDVVDYARKIAGLN